MEKLALMDEQIQKFTNSSQRNGVRVWTFTILVQGQRIPLTPLAYDRDFNYDELWMNAYIEGELDPALIDAVIYPNRRNLQVEITYEYRKQLTDEIPDGLKPKTVVYDVVTSETEFKALSNPSVLTSQPLRAGDQSQVPIRFKVVSPEITEYKQRTVSGVFHNLTVKKLMELLLRPGATPLPDVRPEVLRPEPYWYQNYEGIVGCQITPPDNEFVYPQIVIPFDTLLMELPEFLQENYGIYKNGIASCIDRGIVYVFPVTDFDRFKTETRHLTIFNVDQIAYGGLETTYWANDKLQVEVVSTQESQHVDDSDSIQLKHGLGTVWIDADTFLDGGIDRNPDDTIFASRSSTMKETADIERSDGQTQKKWSREVITSNGWVEESREKQKNVARMVVGWDSSNPDLLNPGMPVMIKTQIGETILEVLGTVVGVHTEERPDTKGQVDRKFRSSTKISMIIQNVGL